jgi:hypothetical protein
MSLPAVEAQTSLRAKFAAGYLVSVGLNFVELGSFAEQNSMRWEARSGKEIYNTVWFNTKFLSALPYLGRRIGANKFAAGY